jgi:hypothetical protein
MAQPYAHLRVGVPLKRFGVISALAQGASEPIQSPAAIKLSADCLSRCEACQDE